MQLVETGVENDVVLALVVFSIQYVLINYESWKYKVKDVRWKVMLKVSLGYFLKLFKLHILFMLCRHVPATETSRHFRRYHICYLFY